MDTIFALSTGAPPAGIGIIRVSGPRAQAVLQAIAGYIPAPRRARRAQFRKADGALLDDGLVLFFPAPHSVTGEDLAEFHCHGGRAIVAALESAIASVPQCRRALPGEFTRRAFAHGRIDLAEAEGLADLLAAETELQRSAAIANAGGMLSRRVEHWRDHLLVISAELETMLDFADEEDGSGAGHTAQAIRAQALAQELAEALAAPSAEPLREGFRVALAGPPNAGKSTLFNALVESEAAITAPLAGTTRDVLVRQVAINGVPFTLVDMAGLRDGSEDAIEAIGIARAEGEIARADLVLWLGPEGQGPAGAWEVEAQCDRAGHLAKAAPDQRISALTGDGIAALKLALANHALRQLPRPGELALNRRQRELLGQAATELAGAGAERDPLLLAERLRQARQAFDALLGRTSTEDVLDTLFGRFCIGK